MPIDKRPTRQPATLHENLGESNIYWDRDDNKLWRCKINSCNACFKRKAGLVNHRREAHELSKYQANIPDQRGSKEDVKVMQRAAKLFLYPTIRKRVPTPELVNELRSNGSKYVRKQSEFEDYDYETLQRMFSYGLDNGYFEDHPSLGFELVAMRLLKEAQEHPHTGLALSIHDLDAKKRMRTQETKKRKVMVAKQSQASLHAKKRRNEETEKPKVKVAEQSQASLHAKKRMRTEETKKRKVMVAEQSQASLHAKKRRIEETEKPKVKVAEQSQAV